MLTKQTLQAVSGCHPRQKFQSSYPEFLNCLDHLKPHLKQKKICVRVSEPLISLFLTNSKTVEMESAQEDIKLFRQEIRKLVSFSPSKIFLSSENEMELEEASLDLAFCKMIGLNPSQLELKAGYLDQFEEYDFVLDFNFIQGKNGNLKENFKGNWHSFGAWMKEEQTLKELKETKEILGK